MSTIKEMDSPECVLKKKRSCTIEEHVDHNCCCDFCDSPEPKKRSKLTMKRYSEVVKNFNKK